MGSDAETKTTAVLKLKKGTYILPKKTAVDDFAFAVFKKTGVCKLNCTKKSYMNKKNPLAKPAMCMHTCNKIPPNSTSWEVMVN